MGIFGTKTDQDAREKQIIKDLDQVEETRRIAYRLNDIKNNPDNALMKPYFLYFDVLEMVMSNSQFKEKDYGWLLDTAEGVYKDVFVYEEETPDFENLRLVFLELFDKDSAVNRGCFNVTFFNLFQNKHNYIKWLKSIYTNYAVKAIEDYYVPYALVARSFFVDEDTFTANIISVTNKLMKAVEPQSEYDKALKNLEHMVGIYNVDESRIMTAEQHIDAAEALVKKSTQVLELLNERVKTIENLSRTAVANVNQMCESQVTVAKADLGEISEKLNQAYNDFLENQKRLVLFDRQQFVNGAFEEAEQKLNELKAMADRTVSAAGLELARINQESGSAVSKLDAYVKNEENLQKLISAAATLPEQGVIEAVAARSGVQVNVQPSSQLGTANQSSAGANMVMASPAVAPAVSDFTEDEQLLPVNPLLDDSLSFADRYERVMQKKTELEASGEHFHEMFDDVMIAVMENSNPYLIGPSGCGKTYMVSQIAKVLGADFIDIGYINEEYDILGFQTADGGYSKPNFYRCYKYGKIAFCDELDNGNSRATVKLNSFLSNTEDASYNFPHGECVKRHANFRMIGAGNTAGNGADSNYNTREKIEESVQQRFTPIYVGYDNEVEKSILRGYEDWFDFVVLFRQATDAWSENNFGDAPGIITTRDVTRIKKYLDHQSFSIEKIVKYEFVQTKSVDYLAYLDEFMRLHIKADSKAQGILNAFSSMVIEKRRESV